MGVFCVFCLNPLQKLSTKKKSPLKRMTWTFVSQLTFPVPPQPIGTCWARVRVGSKAWRWWATMRWNPPNPSCREWWVFCILKSGQNSLDFWKNIRNTGSRWFEISILDILVNKNLKCSWKCWCWSTNISPIEIVLLHWMFRWPKLVLSTWLYCNCTVQQLPSWIYQETLGNPLVKWLCRLMFLFKY